MRFLIKCIVILWIFVPFFTRLKSTSAQVLQTETNGNPVKQIKYSQFDSWYYREVRESLIIGGTTQKLYEIGELNPHEDKNNPLLKDRSSLWGTTNMYIKMGVDIGVNCVFPEKNRDGYCCRMETRIREVRLIGVKLKVLVSGTVFLGEVIEPVRNVKDPVRKLNHGVPFTGKPKAIQFSYKYKPGQERVKSVYHSEHVEGPDKAELCLILQKRWEDEKGNVYATRIGGIRNFFNDTGNSWVTDTTITVKYGDITREPFYDPEIMGLIPGISELYVKNSKNEMVPLTETGWDTHNETPTHLVLYFTSSYEGINYTGSPESVLWVDNIQFIY